MISSPRRFQRAGNNKKKKKGSDRGNVTLGGLKKWTNLQKER